MGELLLFLFDFDGFEVFGFEDLTAIQALDVVHAVSSRDDLGAGMVTSGLHKQRLDEIYSIRAKRLVKPPGGHKTGGRPAASYNPGECHSPHTACAACALPRPFATWCGKRAWRLLSSFCRCSFARVRECGARSAPCRGTISS